MGLQQRKLGQFDKTHFFFFKAPTEPYTGLMEKLQLPDS
jgi:hypothetical protein